MEPLDVEHQDVRQSPEVDLHVLFFAFTLFTIQFDSFFLHKCIEALVQVQTTFTLFLPLLQVVHTFGVNLRRNQLDIKLVFVLQVSVDCDEESIHEVVAWPPLMHIFERNQAPNAIFRKLTNRTTISRRLQNSEGEREIFFIRAAPFLLNNIGVKLCDIGVSLHRLEHQVIEVLPSIPVSYAEDKRDPYGFSVSRVFIKYSHYRFYVSY